MLSTSHQGMEGQWVHLFFFSFLLVTWWLMHLSYVIAKLKIYRQSLVINVRDASNIADPYSMETCIIYELGKKWPSLTRVSPWLEHLTGLWKIMDSIPVSDSEFSLPHTHGTMNICLSQNISKVLKWIKFMFAFCVTVWWKGKPRWPTALWWMWYGLSHLLFSSSTEKNPRWWWMVSTVCLSDIDYWAVLLAGEVIIWSPE